MSPAPETPTLARQLTWIVLLSVACLILINLPFIAAYNVTDHIFNGTLINPLDANTYLAKMRQGWRGAWLFTLPYTSEPGEGVFLLPYYLFLGHLARWLGLSLETVFHAARVAGSFVMFLAAYNLILEYFKRWSSRLGAWLLFVFGSGLGWLATLWGGFTHDLWVAEFIPFLSTLVNPHFPLAAALQLWLFKWMLLPNQHIRSRILRSIIFVVLLVLIQPIGVVVLLGVVGAYTAWRVGHLRLWRWTEFWPLLVLALFGLPYLGFVLWVTATHPVLRLWNAQNLTPSPNLVEALLAGGWPLLLSWAGLLFVGRRRNFYDSTLVGWYCVGIALVYLPLALQRRLSLGLWMPIVLLAVFGWREMFALHFPPVWRRVLLGLLVATVGLSNLLVYAAMWVAINQREPAVFLTLDEAAGLNWLRDHAGAAVVLASPELSLFIPARTEARVVYGHPFETVNAEFYKAAVSHFYETGELPSEPAVSYIVYGEREKALGQAPALRTSAWHKCFEQASLAIYGQSCPNP